MSKMPKSTKISRPVFIICLCMVVCVLASPQTPQVDRETVAKIREEGFQHSRVMDIAGYISDVLGARLTLS